MKTIPTLQRSVFLLFLLLIAVLPNADAQVIYVDINATGANDGTSWENAYTDLSMALTNADMANIWVAAGTYHPGSGAPDTLSSFFVGSQVNLYGGFAGTEVTLDERDFEANPTILSGDINEDDIEDDFGQNKSDNVYHVVVVDSLLDKVIIDGFTIRGGNTSADTDRPRYEWRGGGVFTYSPIELRNSICRDNFAASGAGVYLSPAVPGGCSGSVFYNCVFSHSTCTNQSAGIYIEVQDDITIKHCEFSDNTTVRGALYPNACTNVLVDSCRFTNNITASMTDFGGALFSWQNIGLTISNSEFTLNTAGNGGVMYLDGRETLLDTNNIIIENCIFSDNIADNWGGGALYTWRASYTLKNSFLNISSAPNTGGHIYNGGDDKEILVKNCEFRGGSAGGGWGGAVATYGERSFITYRNNTFSFNHANTSGGAVTTGFLSTAYIINNTFDNNTANFGGAVFAQNDSTSLVIEGSNFESNSAENVGGAISLSGDIYCTIDKCDFTSNMSENGGAISASSSGVNPDLKMVIGNSKFLFNTAAGQGGALEINDMTTDIVSCLFSLNSTTDLGYGGAMINNVADSSSSEVRVINNTFVENSATNGPCIAQWEGPSEAFAIMYLQNNIFVNGGGDEYVIEDGEPEVMSLGGNFSDDSSIGDHSSNPLDGQVATSDDVMFVDLNNFDFRLDGESPMIDMGVDDGAPEFDHDGNPRVGQVDVGAYEYQGTATQEVLPNNGAFTLAPNPARAHTLMTLDNDWQGPLLINVLDLEGKTVKVVRTQKVDDILNRELPVANLPAGMYHITVTNGEYILVTSMQKM